ncbi:hypothetical protein NC652_009357 [Populus alba x Populus x berolinensis]|nr:hypothetical protein NC652_009357 [Populus alba x Populus x berolinensis]
MLFLIQNETPFNIDFTSAALHMFGHKYKYTSFQASFLALGRRFLSSAASQTITLNEGIV